MYKSDILNKAIELKNSQAARHKAAYNARLEKLNNDILRLGEIDTALANLGAQLMVSAMKGNLEEINLAKEQSEALSNEKKMLLDSAGIKPFAPLCPICEDSGMVSGKICNCVKFIAKELCLNELKEKSPVEQSSFEQFDLSYYPDDSREKMKKLFDFSFDYANNFNYDSTNVLFMGKCGLGKTHLSLAIAKKVLDKGFGVIYGSAQDLFADAEKEHFSYSAQSEKRDSLLNCDLLIIDDLGTEFTTSFTQSLFYNIVNTRILNRKPTLINTNLSFEELDSRYTSRITSRFLGEYTIKLFVGNDIRQIKAMQKLK